MVIELRVSLQSSALPSVQQDPQVRRTKGRKGIFQSQWENPEDLRNL